MASVIILLPPHAKRITSLDFVDSRWVDIRMFSASNSGPLPLFHTLNINAVGIGRGDSDLLSPPLFNTAITCRNSSCTRRGHHPWTTSPFRTLPSSNYPRPQWRNSRLRNCSTSSRFHPLPKVESLCLVVSDGESGYRLAVHLSCPSAKHTLLTHEAVRSRKSRSR